MTRVEGRRVNLLAALALGSVTPLAAPECARSLLPDRGLESASGHELGALLGGDMEDTIAVAALALTNIALLVGWVVSGTQRVTEELTTERRSAYIDLLVCADAIRSSRSSPEDIRPLEERALFLATQEMFDAGLIERLVAGVADDKEWRLARSDFLRAARFESHHNTTVRRKLQQSRIYGGRRL